MVTAAEHVGFCEPHAMLARSINVSYRNMYSAAFAPSPADSWASLDQRTLPNTHQAPCPRLLMANRGLSLPGVCHDACTERTLQMPLCGELSHALCFQQHHTICAHPTTEAAHGERSLSTFPLPHASCRTCTSIAVSCIITGQHIATSWG